MSDSKLRDLERRWRETGTVEDEAAYLEERIRVGDLTREGLELAAYCGRVTAIRLVQRRVWKVPNAPTTVKEWVRELAPWGREVSIRAVVATLRAIAPVAEHDRPRTEDAASRLQAWVECPCDHHVQDAVELCRATGQDSSRIALMSASVGACAITVEESESDTWSTMARWCVEVALELVDEPLLGPMVRSEIERWALAPRRSST